MPPVAQRLRRFGQTIFAEMSRLALERGAVNLGQGFPDFDGPEFVKEAARRAIRDGHGQYAPMSGVPALTGAIADRFREATGIDVDPDRNVTVTSGCTEALAATFLGLVEPGDEVVLIEPYYDSYPACVALAGARPRFVRLRPPDFRLDPEELAAAAGPRTAAVVVNTPHNPTGRVFDDAELEAIAGVCREFDAVAVADEVYEHLVFEGRHRSIAGLADMWERTITLSSIGKTFSLTGWKVGWAVGPEDLTAGVRSAHQFLTFATATPLQFGAAAALRAPAGYFADFVAGYRTRRDLLLDGLTEAGFTVFPPQGTYFALADHTGFGFADDVAFTRHLVDTVGVAAIPPSAFYDDPAGGASLVRFAFCKEVATIEEAIVRLRRLGRGSSGPALSGM